MKRRRPARPWLAACLIGVLAATYLLAWEALVEHAHCDQGGFCGLGEGLLMMYVGGPVSIVLTWLALRLSGARSALLGTGALVLSLLVLVNTTERLDPPPFAWPFLLAALAALWFVLELRVAPPSAQQVQHDRQEH